MSASAAPSSCVPIAAVQQGSVVRSACRNRDFRFRRRMSWPLSAMHAELDDRHARMAVIDTSAQRAESAFGAELTGRLAWRLLTFCDATFDQRSLLSLEPLLARCRRWIRSGSSGRSWAGRVGRTIAAGVGLVRDIRDRCGDPGVALFFKQVSASPPRGRRPTTGRPHLGPVPGQRPDARGGQAVITNDPSSLQDRLLVRETALISGRWTWAGCVTCGTAASACGFRCSSNRSAGSRLRQVGACWTAAPGTSTRHE
jgi:hypothetical protein